MKVCGIIAEYNPFHSGHAYQIAEARARSGCDFVIVVMSGDFVQRGAPALTDKYMRARTAVYEGADLVLMLPVYGSTASAEGFARAGIAALLSTGVTDAVSFGCEDLRICSDPYRALARSLSDEQPDFRAAIAKQLSDGIPYARARVEAVRTCYGSDFDLSLLDAPNNLLAFEYLRALESFHADVQLCPVRRLGSYHDTACQGSKPSPCTGAPDAAPPAGSDPNSGPATAFTSASACRKLLLAKSAHRKLLLPESACQKLLSESADRQMPIDPHVIPTEVCRLLADYAENYDFLQEDDLSAALHYALLAQKDNGYDMFADCSSDLSARIIHHLESFECFSQFCDLLKNKSVTRARIARALTHILLRLPAQPSAPLASDDGRLPYLRVLGFRRSAAPLLHEIRLRAHAPLITRISEAERLLSPEGMLYFRQDLFASEIYHSILLQKCGKSYPDDYRRTIEIV